MRYLPTARRALPLFACLGVFALPAAADEVVPEDLIVQGSLCVGTTCVDGETFLADLLRLRAENIHIYFADESGPGFASNDWSFRFNGSGLTGGNFFEVLDRGIDGTTSNSVFRIDAGAGGAIMLGYDASSSGLYTLSLGSAGEERRITHLADGIADTDAVNLRQLNAAISAASLGGVTSTFVTDGDAATLLAAQTYADAGDAATLASAQTYADTGDAATLTQANSYTDARTAGIAETARVYTDSRFNALATEFTTLQNDVWQRMDRTDRRIDRSGAMSTAMAQMTANAAGGRSDRGRVAVGVGTQNGHGALALGYGRKLGERGSVTFGAAVSGSDTSAGVGLGFDL